MSVSETKDREELTKRKKLAKKINSLFLMIFNSSVGTVNELEYYEEKKKDVGTSGFRPVESTRLKTLLAPSRDDLRKQLKQSKFINGISLNVAGVRLIEKKSSATKFWNSVTMINQLQTNDNFYEFLIKSRIDLPESEYIIVGRRYGEFKALHSNLKKKFPGKHLPSLPSKVKSEINVGDTDANEEDDDDEDSEEIKEELEKEADIRERLHEIERELKIDLLQIPEQSEEFQTAPSSPVRSTKSPKMLNSPKFTKSPNTPKDLKSPSVLPKKMKNMSFPWSPTKPEKSVPQSQDKINAHLPREKTRLGLRSYLRTLLEDIEISHCEILKEFLFKGRILHFTDKETEDIAKRESLDLLLILNQLKFQNETYKKIQDLKQSSMVLRNVLLKEDNGLQSVFHEIKVKENINELSPMLRSFIDWCKIEISATIYQLFLGQDSSFELFSQVKRIHSLMPYTIMISILKFTNPMSIMKAMIDLLMANPFGGKSLLQSLFFGILSDDIKSQNKVITELEAKIDDVLLINRLKWFIFDSVSDGELVENLRLEAKETRCDLLLTVLISPQVTENEPSHETIGDLMESYQEYKKLTKVKNEQDAMFINQELASLYSNLRQLYKLYIRNHDKEIMQKLWSEPELILIMKDLLTMFYQPLVNLFKHSHVDQAFKSFQRFMDDLIILIDRLNNEIYSIDPNRIVTEIMNVLNKHENEFYKFLHNVYQNDKDLIFEGLINWINGLLKLLRLAKSENEHERVDLLKLINNNSEVKYENLVNELDQIIRNVKKSQELMKKRLVKEQQEKDKKMTSDDRDIQQNWDVINQDLEFFKYDDFGINENDIADFHEESDNDDCSIDDDDDDNDTCESKPTSELKNDEIAKLLGGFKHELTRVLNSYR
jgi:uncharacterized protein YktA (UPF0223 family)